MTDPLMLRALRGAITVDRDDGAEIRSATAEMLTAMLEGNDVAGDQIVSMMFTATPDLRADFPAVAAREMGMTRVPLMCASEIDVPGALPLCIRVMVHCYMPAARTPRHVYLREAVRLRRDLADEADIPSRPRPQGARRRARAVLRLGGRRAGLARRRTGRGPGGGRTRGRCRRLRPRAVGVGGRRVPGPLSEPLPLELAADATWGAFYARRRLMPMARLARDRGALTGDDVRRVEAVATRCADGAFDTGAAPARLHGNLWSGNVMWTPAGAVLIDPAACGGDGETDLAMMAPFGFPHLEEAYAAYDGARPPAPGRDGRRRLHQLHPLLVHAALFGAGYRARVVEAARAYA